MKKFVSIMKNIKDINNCYGCGVCVIACPKSALKLHLNNDGFYAPVLSDKLCVNCGICVKVCAFSHNNLALERQNICSYGAWSNDRSIRLKSSSGGVAFELSRFLLSQGYKSCCVKYDESKQRAEHYIASCVDELYPSIGSKYLQSYTIDAFKSISRNEKYILFGTPCQIDSFRRYIQLHNVEDNFILVDFFCHSVPSMLAWNKYRQIVEKRIGVTVYASWRHKFNGWHDSWVMVLCGNRDCTNNKQDLRCFKSCTVDNSQDKIHISKFTEDDLFYNLFLGDYCSNPACKDSCKYKYDKSSADIRLGDFWGKTYENNDEGVSSVVAFTERGNDIVKSIDCTLNEFPFEVVAEGQMKANIESAYTSKLIYKKLKDENSKEGSFKCIFFIERVLQKIRRMINKCQIRL